MQCQNKNLTASDAGDSILYGACKGGHVDIVHLLIAKGWRNWEYGLYGAFLGGHSNLVELMLAMGATTYTYAMYHYCRVGDIANVKRFLTKKYGCTKSHIVKQGLYEACKYGHIDIIDLLVVNEENNVKNAFWIACYSRQIEVMRYLFGKGANSCWCGKSIKEHF